MKAKQLWHLATALLLAVAGFGVWAQPAYPTKPIDIVVPYATGGSTDICARLIAKYVSQKKGVAVSVVNKPGGGGLVGIREVLTSRPDGYTLLADTHGASSMVGAFNEPADVPFDWRNRTWIAVVDKDVLLYLVKEDSSWKTLKDVGAYAKQNPGQVPLGVDRARRHRDSGHAAVLRCERRTGYRCRVAGDVQERRRGSRRPCRRARRLRRPADCRVDQHASGEEGSRDRRRVGQAAGAASPTYPLPPNKALRASTSSAGMASPARPDCRRTLSIGGWAH